MSVKFSLIPIKDLLLGKPIEGFRTFQDMDMARSYAKEDEAMIEATEEGDILRWVKRRGDRGWPEIDLPLENGRATAWVGREVGVRLAYSYKQLAHGNALPKVLWDLGEKPGFTVGPDGEGGYRIEQGGELLAQLRSPSGHVRVASGRECEAACLALEIEERAFLMTQKAEIEARLAELQPGAFFEAEPAQEEVPDMAR